MTNSRGELAIEASALARRAVEIVEDRQASDIVMLDLRTLNTFADYFVICTASSDRQLRAINDAVEELLRNEAGRSSRNEGSVLTGWVLMDYGDVVVHLFSQAQRDYYRLEQLWSKATPVIVVQ